MRRRAPRSPVQVIEGDSYTAILTVYEASNGDATRALYERLEALGPVCVVAVNLFRAHKNSSRKHSRPGSQSSSAICQRRFRQRSWTAPSRRSCMSRTRRPSLMLSGGCRRISRSRLSGWLGRLCRRNSYSMDEHQQWPRTRLPECSPRYAQVAQGAIRDFGRYGTRSGIQRANIAAPQHHAGA